MINKGTLYLHSRSSGAYEILRKSGCLKLPSQRTLRDCIHYTESHNGFSATTNSELMRVANVHNLEE